MLSLQCGDARAGNLAGFRFRGGRFLIYRLSAIPQTPYENVLVWTKSPYENVVVLAKSPYNNVVV